jgi:hypothetical protein
MGPLTFREEHVNRSIILLFLENWEKGELWVYRPPLPLKLGIPAATDIPAPGE